MTVNDEVLEVFRRRQAESHVSDADERRLKTDKISLARRKIPEVVAKLRENGYPEYPDNKYRAQEVTVDGRTGIVWPMQIGTGSAAAGLYVDGRYTPPRGEIVLTDDMGSRRFRIASDDDLMKLSFEALNGIANGLLNVLTAKQKEPEYLNLKDPAPVNPYWALHTVNP